jgi:hypothetical protein
MSAGSPIPTSARTVADFCYSIHAAGEEKILAIADSSILGKYFEEGEFQIDISSQFYGQKRCDEGEAIKLIKGSTIINAAGKEIIKLLVENNVIDQDKILFIKGVPHAQFISL